MGVMGVLVSNVLPILGWYRGGSHSETPSVSVVVVSGCLVGGFVVTGEVKIRKHAGIASQYQIDATVDGQIDATVDGETIGFVGSVYGGPVVMILSSGHQVFVSDPGRFGVFGTDWVRRFVES